MSVSVTTAIVVIGVPVQPLVDIRGCTADEQLVRAQIAVPAIGAAGLSAASRVRKAAASSARSDLVNAMRSAIAA
jgi:hypothetical protein